MKRIQRRKRSRRIKLPHSLRHVLRTSVNPLQAVSTLRPITPLRLYPALIDWLLTYGVRARDFHIGRTPQALHLIRAERQVLQGVSLEGELVWTTAYLKHEAAKINRFVVARQALQDKLLLGSGQACIEALDQLDQDFGVSLWSIEQRIAVLALHDGLEAQKAFTQLVRDQSKSAAIRFFVSMWSVRNEMATHFDTFRRELVSRIPDWTESKPFARYALFRCADYWEPSAANVANFLRWEFNNSTIDVYETFLKLVQRSLAMQVPAAQQMISRVSELNSVIEDPRISMLLFASTHDPQFLSPVLPATTPLSDVRFEAGDLPSVSEIEAAAGIEDLVTQSLWQADGKSDHTTSNNAILRDRIVQSLADVARKHSRFELSRADLLHIYTNLTGLDIAGCIQLATIDQTASDPPQPSWLGIEAYCKISKLHAGFLQYLPLEAQNVYSEALNNNGTYASTLAAEQLRAGLEISNRIRDLDPTLVQQLKAQADFNRGDYDTVAKLRNDAVSGRLSHTRSLARLVASALIRLGKTREAIQFIVERAISDPACTATLPIASCYSAIDDDLNIDMASDLSLPILVDLQSRHISEQTTTLRYRYEDFLSSLGCTRPSQLVDKQEEVPRELLIYFLRQICIPRVMQLCLEFPTSRAVSEERLAVCVLLRSIDRSNASVYDAEILEITRQQAISQGVQVVEQSKIWIDQEPIRRWAEKHLHEGFKRLIDLQAAGITSQLEVDQTQLEPINAEQVAKALEVPELPSDEAGTLLRRLVSQFLAHCFMNKPHGLDSFLSIRVRHGVLAGQMRAAPEAEKIITLQREAGSGDYFPSEYWREKFSGNDPEIAFKVDARLQRFSREYDEMVDHFVGDHFQIQRDEKPLGLFHFGYLPTDLLILQADLHQASSFDVFIDRCFQIFWNSVDASLEQIREHIDKTLQMELNRLFVELINDLESITTEYPHPELGYAVRNAHTRATNALEQVKEWFRPARPRAPITATFQELLDISLQVVRNMDANFNPRLRVSAEDVPLFLQLQRFTDIFIILFDNIRRHCGIGSRPMVTIDAGLSGKYLNIQVTNAVSADVINEASLGKLTTIREKIEMGLYQRAVNTEGGTGLLKIRNILSQELADASPIEFGFQGLAFSVKLRMSTLILAVGGTDEETSTG